MIKNQFDCQPLSTSWTINDFKENEHQRVIRKFINSAIYVEKAVTEMPPLRKTSPLSVIEDADESDVKSSSKKCSEDSNSTLKVTQKTVISKRIPENKNKFPSSFVSSASHLESDKGKRSFCREILKSSHASPESGYKANDQSSTNSSSTDQSQNSVQSDQTIKADDFEPIESSEVRLSLTGFNTNRTNRTFSLDPKEKQEIVQNWVARKESEKKHKALQEAKLVKQKEEDRQRLIEKERETFKKWLKEKKKEEERKKIQRELEEQEQKLREAEKEKRKVENEISFNLWLRKKKRYDLEKKIREKLALLQMYEEKQVRVEENEKAYQEWLENAKNRPKPIPMNKGLQSLCSSASVTYINPIPWTPNIDPNIKPSSQ